MSASGSSASSSCWELLDGDSARTLWSPRLVLTRGADGGGWRACREIPLTSADPRRL